MNLGVLDFRGAKIPLFLGVLEVQHGKKHLFPGVLHIQHAKIPLLLGVLDLFLGGKQRNPDVLETNPGIMHMV